MSRRSPVWVSSPSVKILEVATAREPWPTCRPVGKCVAVALLRARRCVMFSIKQVLKFDFALLEAGGVDVRQVVGDDVQVELLGFHAGGGGIKCA